MKICFIYNSIFTLGGIQRCITNLSNYLVNKGYEVTVICCDSNIKMDRTMYNLDDKVNVIFIKNSFIKRVINIYRKPFIYLNNRFGIFNNNLFVLKKLYYPYYHNVKKYIECEDYDVVISSASYFNSLLSFLNIDNKIKIGWQHSSYYFYFEKEGYKNKEAIIKEMFNNLDNYVVLIDDDKNKIKKNLGYNTTRIYNALEFFPKENGKFEYKKFIAAGRLATEKRFDLLIKNFNEFSKINKDWKLDLYGEGPERNTLQKLIDDLNLSDRVRLCGYCSDIMDKYLESSIYCMTSVGEGFGMTVVEAMSCGLPVICYDIPAMREIIDSDCGFIVENDNEFIDKMLLLSSDKDLYMKLSKNAKKRSKNFDIQKIGLEWINLINTLKKNKEKNK